ncbi:hypothetical protein PAMC26577_25875 [Caballeronia sordidicola]|uniref:Uncharacterized protein n=1 Tax=Caballeronia sordidicola TaxID=196367 RepID=A0A242MIJ5_CABSO|nr:hypothetical protein PAMC26577_25875 [Caballeronia sordidicola]
MFQHRRAYCTNGSHPKTAAALRIAASTTVKFTAGRLFKDAINQ